MVNLESISAKGVGTTVTAWHDTGVGLWIRNIGPLVDVGSPPYSQYMTPELADYIEAGKTLDVDERLEAARQLLLSVDHDPDANQDDLDAVWDQVIDRRANEIFSGKAKLVDGRDAHAQLRAEVAALSE
jgi:hypothetical protein